ncbi:MAG TPA: calcium-binding protein, partial [Tabrizicola sp.]|nr:calcium-binding protein [Tabrizicola sp.]
RSGESTIGAYSVAPNGTMTLVGTRVLDGAHTGVDISSLVPVTVGGNRFLISLSLEADVVRAFPVAPNGTLGNPTMIGASQGLGINDPSDVEVVQMAGVTYLVVASAGSSSVSVLGIGADGTMRVADHVIDTLDTRFQGVQALATATVGDRVFVIAGGGDEGITVMTLTPEGQLLNCGQLLQTPGIMLDNITAMTAQVVGGRIELFITGEGSGITRLQIDPGTLTPIQFGGGDAATLTGADGSDMIQGGDGDEVIQGGAGADIVMDGAGADRLFGGAGADLFVLAADGAADTIGDFQLGIDRIDLSAWGPIHSLAALTITATATGAVISYGDETLELLTPNGQPLQPAGLQLKDVIGLWHALPSGPDPQNLTYGTNQIDLLSGTAGDDMFMVSTGADTIQGGAGFDWVVLTRATGAVRLNLESLNHNTNIASGQTYVSIEGIIGSAFSDTLTGDFVANRIEGMEGNDRLSGVMGNDSLYGGSGNDMLLGGPGADLLDGGLGRDRASYREAWVGVLADLGQPSRNTGEAAGDSYLAVEDLEGSGSSDTLIGDAQANQLIGMESNDRLEGRQGSDSLFGGDGNDTLAGDDGADRLDGGAGVDFASYESNPAAIRIDLLTPSLTTGDAAGDIFTSIEGFILTGFADSFAGNDLADRAMGGVGNDTLTGRGGSDWLSGGAGNDALYGGEGEDTLLGGAGSDRLEGGLGRDLVSHADAGAGVRVDLTNGALNLGEARGDVLVGIEDLEGSGFGDTLAGDGAANGLWGLDGSDLLQGRAGNDTLMGGAGTDLLVGGEGLDLASYAESGSLRVDLGEPGLSTGEAAGDRFEGIEGLQGGVWHDTLLGDGGANWLIGGAGQDLLDGRSGSDTLAGGDGWDTLWGGEGDDRLEGGRDGDRLEGGAGDDRLLGEDGNDTLIGGAGSDTLDGGTGHDLVTYAGLAEALVLDLGAPGLNAGAAAGDVLVAIEEVLGTAQADRMAGDGLANIFRGEAGLDWLSGGAGNDALYGGEGEDTLL